MGHLSSKAANDSFDESTSAYLGPSGLHLGLESTSVSQGLSQLQGEVLRQTRSLQQVSHLTYEGFLASITELNEISGHFLDANGKQLVFAVKKGSDTSFLWKATVRVACVKIDASSKAIDSYRCLNLKQYLRVYNSLRTQSAAVKSSRNKENKSIGMFFQFSKMKQSVCSVFLQGVPISFRQQLKTRKKIKKGENRESLLTF